MTDACDDGSCPICGSDMDLETCWCCFGEGGFHDCGQDICCCDDPEEANEPCEECDGEGNYLVCPTMHTEEQITAWREREQAKDASL